HPTSKQPTRAPVTHTPTRGSTSAIHACDDRSLELFEIVDGTQALSVFDGEMFNQFHQDLTATTRFSASLSASFSTSLSAGFSMRNQLLRCGEHSVFRVLLHDCLLVMSPK